MSYQTKVAAWQKFGMDAIDKLMGEYSELCLSLPEEKVIAESLVSKTKLSEEEPATADAAYTLLERFLAELIVAGKLKFADFGVSTLGQEQLRQLVAIVNPPAASAAESPAPADDFADVIKTFNGPSHELNRKMQTEPFRTRFNKAVAAGLI